MSAEIGYLAFTTPGEARRFLQEYLFDEHQRLTSRDQQVTCVDVSPVAEWTSVARKDEIEALCLKSPIRPPFPVTLLGCVSLGPTGLWFVSGLSIQRVDQGHKKFSEFGECLVVRNWIARGPDQICWLGLTDGGLLKGTPEVSDGFTSHMIEITLAGLAMFHVRNIGLSQVTYPRYLRRRVERDLDHEGPQVFHTLTLTPFRSGPGDERRAEPTGDRPLHLVRGHFATYTPERPLFGKYSGMFWRPEHEAGDQSIAVVRKTFRFDLNDEPVPRNR